MQSREVRPDMQQVLKVSLATASFRRTASAALFVFQSCSTSAIAEYYIQPGDVLELSVASRPELTQRLPVENDGEISIAYVGELVVKNLPISKVRELVKSRLTNAVLRPRGSDRADMQTILREEVILRIATYRPIYISGNVERPGEIPYRPGMSVRQAVSAAGGFDPWRLGSGNNSAKRTDWIDWSAEQKVLTIALENESIKIERLKTIIDNKTTFDIVEKNSEFHSRMVALEKEIFSSSKSDIDEEKAHLETLIKLSGDRISVLRAQSETEGAGAKLDEEDVKRVVGLYQQNLASATRVSEVRRAALLSASRALQTSVAADAAVREREEAMSRLKRIDLSQRLKHLEELAEATKTSEQLKARLTAVTLKSGLGSTAKKGTLISRKVGGNVAILVADENSELEPGDVIEVGIGK